MCRQEVRAINKREADHCATGVTCIIRYCMSGMVQVLLLVGTYTQKLDHVNGTGKGIYALKMDAETGHLSEATLTLPIEPNPSYGVVVPFQDSVRYYFVAEYCGDSKLGDSGVVALSDSLKVINMQPAHGISACFITPDLQNKHVAVANYMSGTVSLLPIREDGGLGPVIQVIQLSHFSNAVPSRQEAPHAHMVLFKDEFAFVADLGADRVYQFLYDHEIGKLVPNPAAEFWELPAGSGPRHLASLTGSNFVYVLTELDSSVFACKLDQHSGTLTLVSKHSCLPPGFDKPNNASAIRISFDGKDLYTANRGHDSIAHFRIKADGDLIPLSIVDINGKTPRDFIIDKTDRFLVVAHQDSNLLVTFVRDQSTGNISRLPTKVDLPSPASILFSSVPVADM